MIIFDQLRISDAGDKMYINAHVNDADYFKNVYIESVTIMTSEKVSETTPEAPTSNYIYKKTFDGSSKDVDLVLTALDFTRTWETTPKAMAFKEGDISNTLFFVYIKCTGTPGACTPCRLDEETTLGVTFDENILYQRVMDYTKELGNSCTIPLGYIDFILLWYAFKSAIETEHYIEAIKFYNILFGTVNSEGHRSVIKSCGCHG